MCPVACCGGAVAGKQHEAPWVQLQEVNLGSNCPPELLSRATTCQPGLTTAQSELPGRFTPLLLLLAFSLPPASQQPPPRPAEPATPPRPPHHLPARRQLPASCCCALCKMPCATACARVHAAAGRQRHEADVALATAAGVHAHHCRQNASGDMGRTGHPLHKRTFLPSNCTRTAAAACTTT